MDVPQVTIPLSQRGRFKAGHRRRWLHHRDICINPLHLLTQGKSVAMPTHRLRNIVSTLMLLMHKFLGKSYILFSYFVETDKTFIICSIIIVSNKILDEQIFYQFILYFLGFQICIFRKKNFRICDWVELAGRVYRNIII